MEIYDCDALEEIFYLEGINGKEIDDSATTQFRKLSISHLKNLKSVWNKDLQGLLTFQNLQTLKVIDCPCLKCLFPVSVAQSLVQLEVLKICSCGVEEIVAYKNEDEAAFFFLFPNLTSLTLISLHQLRRFGWGRFTTRWPPLKKLNVCNCDKAETLFQEIGLEGDLVNTIQQPLFWVEKVQV